MEIREVSKRLKITTLYVTHDQLEALTMANRVGVMNDGQIIQEGSSHEIYKVTKNRFVANFIGLANFLPGRVSARDKNGLGEVETATGTIRCTLSENRAVGDEAVVMVRPEDLTVCQDRELPDHNVLEGRVELVVFTGEMLDCSVSVSDQLLRLKVHPSMLLEPGKSLKLYLAPERCRVLPYKDER